MASTVDARSKWTTLTLPKDKGGNQVTVNYYVDTVKNDKDEDELSLFGTVAWVFGPNQMPKDENSVRMCLSIKEKVDEEVGLEKWESINFYLENYKAKNSWT